MLSVNSVSFSFSLFSGGAKHVPATDVSAHARDVRPDTAAHSPQGHPHNPDKARPDHPVWGSNQLQLTIVSLSAKFGYTEQPQGDDIPPAPTSAPPLSDALSTFFDALSDAFSAFLTALTGSGTAAPAETDDTAALPGDTPDVEGQTTAGPEATSPPAPVSDPAPAEYAADPGTEYLLTLMVQQRSLQIRV